MAAASGTGLAGTGLVCVIGRSRRRGMVRDLKATAGRAASRLAGTDATAILPWSGQAGGSHGGKRWEERRVGKGCVVTGRYRGCPRTANNKTVRSSTDMSTN